MSKVIQKLHARVRDLPRLTQTNVTALALGISLLGLSLVLLAGRVHTPADQLGLAAPGDVKSTPGEVLDVKDQMPPGLYPALVAAVQQEATGDYDVTPLSAPIAYQAINPSQGLLATFTPAGTHVTPLAQDGGWTLGMSLMGYGYGNDIVALTGAQVAVEGNLVEYRYGGDASGSGVALTEWYLNGRLGLEQGFTLSGPPGETQGTEPLRIELALSGDLTATLEEGGGAIAFADAEGVAALHYTGLYAYDAEGRELPARLALASGGLAILVDDSAAVYPIVIDPFIQQAKLTASDAAAGDRFGASISISGNTVIVGAFLDDLGVDAGSAYAFERSGSTWTQKQKLTAGDAFDGDEYGTSVDVSEDHAAVGSPKDDDAGASSGSAYMYLRTGSTWGDVQKITAGDAAAGDKFGTSVAIDGDTAVVGAPFNENAETDSGAAYVFVLGETSWSQEAKLTPGDGASNDQFGTSVAIDGNTVVVGADQDDDNGASSGSAYVFVRSGTTWSQQAKLTASDGAANDLFASSVAISGDTAVAASAGHDTPATGAGAVYVFVRSGTTWSQQQKLTASDAGVNDFLGTSIGISGDTLAVGATGDNTNGTAAGAAYLFGRSGTTWTQSQKLLPSDGAASDFFGGSIAIDANRVAVGASRDDDTATDSGSAYVFAGDDLKVTKADSPDPVAAESNLTYTVTVTNNGPVNATGVTLTDTLPSGVTFSSVSTGCTQSGGTVTCSIGTMASDASKVISIVVSVDAPTTGTLSNTASVTGNETELITSNNSATVSTSVGAAPIPGLSQWGLMALAVMLAALFAWRLRRRARPEAA